MLFCFFTCYGLITAKVVILLLTSNFIWIEKLCSAQKLLIRLECRDSSALFVYANA